MKYFWKRLYEVGIFWGAMFTLLIFMLLLLVSTSIEIFHFTILFVVVMLIGLLVIKCGHWA
jgi:hypothetical protein